MNEQQNGGELSPYGGVLWGYLTRAGSYLGVCYKTHENLSQATQLSFGEVTKALGELEARGMIAVEQGEHYMTIRILGFEGGAADPEPEPKTMPYPARVILRDPDLSYRAKGLGVYLLQHPGVTLDDILARTKETRDEVLAAIEELRITGLVETKNLPRRA